EVCRCMRAVPVLEVIATHFADRISQAPQIDSQLPLACRQPADGPLHVGLRLYEELGRLHEVLDIVFKPSESGGRSLPLLPVGHHPPFLSGTASLLTRRPVPGHKYIRYLGTLSIRWRGLTRR